MVEPTIQSELSTINLQEQICLVTGASRGIGAAIADRLCSLGACVIGTATSDRGAEQIGERLTTLARTTGNNQGCDGLCLDVTESQSVIDTVAKISKDHGAPTVLVNNAGITRDDLLMRMSEDEWDAVIDTNLKSVYRTTKACLRPMTRARKGRIINITSVVGAMGNAGQTNYAAAKAGIIGFTKSLAMEVASRNITVNAIAPGFIDTEMTRALTDTQRDELKGHIPLKRLGDVEDIAAGTAFLASPWAAYITGITLHINGGMYMT